MRYGVLKVELIFFPLSKRKVTKAYEARGCKVSHVNAEVWTLQYPRLNSHIAVPGRCANGARKRTNFRHRNRITDVDSFGEFLNPHRFLSMSKNSIQNEDAGWRNNVREEVVMK